MSARLHRLRRPRRRSRCSRPAIRPAAAPGRPSRARSRSRRAPARQRVAVAGVVEHRATTSRQPVIFVHARSVTHLAVLGDQGAEPIERLGESRRVGHEPRRQRAQRAEHGRSKSGGASHSRNTGRSGSSRLAAMLAGRRRRPARPAGRPRSRRSPCRPPASASRTRSASPPPRSRRAPADDQGAAGPRVPQTGDGGRRSRWPRPGRRRRRPGRRCGVRTPSCSPAASRAQLASWRSIDAGLVVARSRPAPPAAVAREQLVGRLGAPRAGLVEVRAAALRFATRRAAAPRSATTARPRPCG